MSKLIAQVQVALIVNGERQVFQPGEELPELTKHDTKALKDGGSAIDPADEALAQSQDRAAQRKADKDFQEARQQVQEANLSTETDATATATAAAKKPTAKR